MDRAVKAVHILCKSSNTWALGGNTSTADLLGALPVLVKGVITLLVALQLAAPKAAKVQVGLAVVVDEAGRVDTVAARDGLRVGREGTLGPIRDSDADAKDVLRVTGWEIEVVAAIALRSIGRPHLLGYPGNVIGAEGYSVVGDGGGWIQRLRAEDVVVGHVVLVAIVVEGNVGLAVVRWVDINLAIEDVGGRVGRVDVCDEGRHSYCGFGMMVKP